MQYRRSRAKGAAFFFTVVTHEQRRFLCDEANIMLTKESFQHVINRPPFTVDAFVLLPDHLHSIWTFPENDSDLSMRWRQIKSYYQQDKAIDFDKLLEMSKEMSGSLCSTQPTLLPMQHRFVDFAAKKSC